MEKLWERLLEKLWENLSDNRIGLVDSCALVVVVVVVGVGPEEVGCDEEVTVGGTYMRRSPGSPLSASWWSCYVVDHFVVSMLCVESVCCVLKVRKY